MKTRKTMRRITREATRKKKTMMMKRTRKRLTLMTVSACDESIYDSYLVIRCSFVFFCFADADDDDEEDDEGDDDKPPKKQRTG
jgi:hypothetical protein